MPHHVAYCEKCNRQFERDRMVYCLWCDRLLCEECDEESGCEIVNLLAPVTRHPA